MNKALRGWDRVSRPLGDQARPVILENFLTRPDPTRPDPTRPDPTRPDPTRPDPTRSVRYRTPPDPTRHDPRHFQNLLTRPAGHPRARSRSVKSPVNKNTTGTSSKGTYLLHYRRHHAALEVCARGGEHEAVGVPRHLLNLEGGGTMARQTAAATPARRTRGGGRGGHEDASASPTERGAGAVRAAMNLRVVAGWVGGWVGGWAERWVSYAPGAFPLPAQPSCKNGGRGDTRAASVYLTAHSLLPNYTQIDSP